MKEAPNLEINDKPEILQILWECCQIPDFVKKTYGHHFEVVSKIFNFLTTGNKKILSIFICFTHGIFDESVNDFDNYFC